MKTIFFKKHWIEKIKDGSKITTIRSKSMYKSGDICSINFKSPLIEIDSVSHRAFNSFSDEEISADGFDSVDAFYKALKEYYPELDYNFKVFHITFHLYTPTM